MPTTDHFIPGQPNATVITEVVLDCLDSQFSQLTMDGEVWVSVAYSGNTSGSPYLQQPSRCRLQVRSVSAVRVMSLLIFHVTCSADNRLVVHSQLKYRDNYKCDPTAWVAPGVELVMTSRVANVSIEINDVSKPFDLYAKFTGLPRTRSTVQVRRVTQHLGMACVLEL